MKHAETYTCQLNSSLTPAEDSVRLLVGTKIDYDNHLCFSVNNGELHTISVFLSPKQAKKLRKQLKKVLKT
jgi:hypothetical protein